VSDLLQVCTIIASHAHEGQCDRIGDRYILHPVRVATRALVAGCSEDAVCAAMLHDVVEDSSWQLSELRAIVGEQVSALVDVLTKRDGEPYADYAQRCWSDADAAVVKLADIADHLDPVRAHGLTESLRRRYQLVAEDGMWALAAMVTAGKAPASAMAALAPALNGTVVP